MPRHLVRPGDCIASLAARHGVAVSDIWDNTANAELRELRSSPHLLQPGDVVELPEPPRSNVRVNEGDTHRLATATSTTRLVLQLRDERFDSETVSGERQEHAGGASMREPEASPPPQSEALGAIPFQLFAGARVIEGTTDAEGRIDERIDAQLTRLRLVLEPGTEHERSLEVKVGYLNPATSDEGLAQRLTNLGFACGRHHGFEAAVAAYQKSRGLGPTGRLDDTTRDRLIEESGG